MERAAIAAALVLAGAAIYYVWPDPASDGTEQAPVTAGDEDSNIFLDTVESMKSTFTAWPTNSEPYQGAIEAAAASNSVPVSILAWLLWKESRYNPLIISGAKRSAVGAMGIAQFMPATAAEELGSVQAALDPFKAIPGAARYLQKLYRLTGGWQEALAAYNWGVGNVTRKGLSLAPAETVDYYTTILNKSGFEVA
jgi:soluble lytic murein transglycosylase-like protein